MVKKYSELLGNRKDLVEKAEKNLESTPEFKRWRWFVLIWVMIVYFAGYLSFDSIAALEDDVENGLKISSDKLGIVYSVYNFPNTIMVIIGGILFDKLGVRISKKLLFIYSIYSIYFIYFIYFYLYLRYIDVCWNVDGGKYFIVFSIGSII